MNDNVYEGKQLLNALGIDPVYVVSIDNSLCRLNDAESRLVYGGDENILAFTCPVADLMFRKSLRYEWGGRGFCMVFRKPPVLLTAPQVLGTMIHEAGHWVADCNQPCRDDPDAGRAVETFWKTLRNESQHHDARWKRATIHLWHRACKVGCEIPLSDVLNLEQYGVSRSSLSTMLAEAERCEGQPIESILASRPTAEPQRKKRRSHVQFIAGRIVQTVGGRTTIDGVPVNEKAFQTFLHSDDKTRSALWPMVTRLELQY
jgi:hypothetical protein